MAEKKINYRHPRFVKSEDAVAVVKYAYKGRGIGYLNGKIVFINGGIVGDSVTLKEIYSKKDYAIANIDKVVFPSIARIAPRCEYAGICGGCDYQFLSHDDELAIKIRLFKERLEKALGPNLPLEIPVTDGRSSGYRNRIRLKKAGRDIGFFRKDSQSLIPVTRCELASESVNKGLARVAAMSEELDFIEVEIFSDDFGGIFYNFIEPNKISIQDVDKLGGTGVTFTDHNGRANVIVDTPMRFDFQLGPKIKYQMISSPAAFGQINTVMNRKLVEYVYSIILGNGRTKHSSLDLYAGSGNFSVPLAHVSTKVLAIEANPLAVRYGEMNMRNLGFRIARFLNKDVAKFLDWNTEKFQTVVLDPPRSGVASSEVVGIGKIRPERIIYISCDIMTLVRDLPLFAAQGYRVISIRPFDLFPRTYHLENVVLLERNAP